MAKNSNLVEVAFKRERRVIYRNRHDLEIRKDDFVIVEAERGQDLGCVSQVGSLVRLKRGKGETRGIIRKAVQRDLEVHEKNKLRELDAFKVCKERIADFGLEMKLVDVEVQFDGSKITFYFTAAQRVDFRELVKSLASQYRTRIELRQIGVRDEAKRIGGCGVCGRQQCCSAFLTEFEQITTQMAKDQQLALNPSKISGNCGRLLCCLRYEEDLYVTSLKKIPSVGATVKIGKCQGRVCAVNVFDCQAQVLFEGGAGAKWVTPQEIEKGHETDARTE